MNFHKTVPSETRKLATSLGRLKYVDRPALWTSADWFRNWSRNKYKNPYTIKTTSLYGRQPFEVPALNSESTQEKFDQAKDIKDKILKLLLASPDNFLTYEYGTIKIVKAQVKYSSQEEVNRFNAEIDLLNMVIDYELLTHIELEKQKLERLTLEKIKELKDKRNTLKNTLLKNLPKDPSLNK